MNEARTELIEAIAELARLTPELRVGQLVCNLANLSNDHPLDLWDAEDEQLLPVARRLTAALREHHEQTAEAARGFQ